MARLYTSDMTKNYSTSSKVKGKGISSDEAKSIDHDDTTGTHKTGDVNISSLYPIAASYCCLISLFPAWPGTHNNHNNYSLLLLFLLLLLLLIYNFHITIRMPWLCWTKHNVLYSK